MGCWQTIGGSQTFALLAHFGTYATLIWDDRAMLDDDHVRSAE